MPSANVPAPTSTSRGNSGERTPLDAFNRKAKKASASQSTERKLNDEEVLIAVMGGSGTGKSTFINLVSGSQLGVGEGLESYTQNIELSKPFILDGRHVRLIDTPGFDDTTRSDTDILNLIADFLCTQYKNGQKLSGIIYLHRISDVRTGGVARQNFTMFQKLCGTEALTNVIIATTRWSQVDPAVGRLREEELKAKPAFFKPLLDAGAQILRHDRDLGSAHGILRSLVVNTRKALLIQTEIVDEGKSVSETAAGLELQSEIIKRAELQKEEMQALMAEMQEAAKDDEARKDLGEEVEALREKMMRLHAEAKKLLGGKELPEPLRSEISLAAAVPYAGRNGDVTTSITTHPSPVAVTQSSVSVHFAQSSQETYATAADSELTAELKQFIAKHQIEMREVQAEMKATIRSKEEQVKRYLEEERKKMEGKIARWEECERTLEEGLDAVRSTVQTKTTVTLVEVEKQRLLILRQLENEKNLRAGLEGTVENERRTRIALEATLREEKRLQTEMKIRLDEVLEQERRGRGKVDVEWQQKLAEERRAYQKVQTSLNEELERRTKLEAQIEQERKQHKLQEDERKKSDERRVRLSEELEREKKAHTAAEESLEKEQHARVALETKLEEEKKAHTGTKTRFDAMLEQAKAGRGTADIEWQQRLADERRAREKVQVSLNEELERRRKLEGEIDAEHVQRKLLEEERKKSDEHKARLNKEILEFKKARVSVEGALEKERQARVALEGKLREEEKARRQSEERLRTEKAKCDALEKDLSKENKCRAELEVAERKTRTELDRLHMLMTNLKITFTVGQLVAFNEGSVAAIDLPKFEMVAASGHGELEAVTSYGQSSQRSIEAHDGQIVGHSSLTANSRLASI